jgi:hypothetical protein
VVYYFFTIIASNSAHTTIFFLCKLDDRINRINENKYDALRIEFAMPTEA